MTCTEFSSLKSLALLRIGFTRCADLTPLNGLSKLTELDLPYYG